MDWLTEYFDVILPVALVLLFLFQRMFVREEEEGPLPSESETQEEARRIQEEIRRKILARQGRGGEEGPVAYEEPRQRPATFPRRQEGPVPLDVERPRPPPQQPSPRPVVRPAPAPAPAAAPAGRDLQEELRIQRERLRQAREAKDEALQRTSGKALRKRRTAAAAPPVTTGDLRSQLLADLATSESLKRAFLLKEIVDRPVGLRDRPDMFSNWA